MVVCSPKLKFAFHLLNRICAGALHGAPAVQRRMRSQWGACGAEMAHGCPRCRRDRLLPQPRRGNLPSGFGTDIALHTCTVSNAAYAEAISTEPLMHSVACRASGVLLVQRWLMCDLGVAVAAYYPNTAVASCHGDFMC